MTDSAAELAENAGLTSHQLPLQNSNGTHPTPKELVAKAIAPVKTEFLRPPPSRTNQNGTAVSESDASQSVIVANENKSKCQLKRERCQVLFFQKIRTVGILDAIPRRINWRPPSYYGRDNLETLMASDYAADWIRISEMLLGRVPDGFTFAPKHKSNAYEL